MPDLADIGPIGRRRPRPLLRTLVGNVLRRHRIGQGRTLADVARAARVSVPYLSEVERGRKEPSSEILAAVCHALRIELSDLLAEVWRDLAADRAPTARHEIRQETRLRTRRGSRDGAPPAGRSSAVVLLAA